MEHETNSRSPSSDRLTMLAGVSLFLAILASAVIMAAFTDWEPGAIIGFLAGVAGLGVPLLAQLRATHQQNATLAKIDDQTNGGLDARIRAGAEKAAETALIRLQTGQLPPPPPVPPPYTPPRKRR